MIAAAKVRTEARFEQVGCAVTRQTFTLVFDLQLPLLAQLEGPDGRAWTFPLWLLGEGQHRAARANDTAVEPALTDPRFVVVSVPQFAVYLPAVEVERYLRLAADAVAAVELSGADLDVEWRRLGGAA